MVESVDMDFSYSGKWNKALPEAYERLLLDAMRGDSTLFTRSNEVEAEWEVIDTIIKHVEADGTDLLVVGSRPLTKSERLHLGSVSETLLRHAPCSVLIARHAHEAVVS